MHKAGDWVVPGDWGGYWGLGWVMGTGVGNGGPWGLGWVLGVPGEWGWGSGEGA